MADVSFIGLGNMGLALATTAAKAGMEVVAWNRTPGKAASLAELGGMVAADPQAAIEASPIIVVCVYDYEVSNRVLAQDSCANALAGRVLVQLTTATPRSAKAMYEWARQNEISYLDGEIIAYPSDVGTDAARLLLAGDEQALTAAQPVLRAFAAELEYLGADPAAASALNLASLSATLGRIIGTINGAAICEATNIPLESFYRTIVRDAGQDSDALVESLRKIATGGLDTTEASVGVWAGIAGYLTEFAHDAGINPAVSDFMSQLLGQSMEAGEAESDIGVLINLLRGRTE